MKIVILNGIDAPIYEQIYKQLATQILDGTLKANTPLPSIRNVAKEVGISIITVKKAWELLEQNKLIYTQSGKGCFVAESAKQNQTDTKLSLAKVQLQKDLPFYKKLGLTLKELIDSIEKLY